MKIKRFKLIKIILLMAICLLVFAGLSFADEAPAGGDGPIVQADGNSEPDDDMDESAFKNPTQVQRAMNLAEAYAAKSDLELEAARIELKRAQAAGDPEAIEAADQNIAEILAEKADTAYEEIEDMREDGMGWGQIAQALGLHPGLLGMRHTKMHKNKKGWGDDISPDGAVSNDEIAEATSRSFKPGASNGHGASMGNGNKGDLNANKIKEKTNSGKNGVNKGNSNGNKK